MRRAISLLFAAFLLPLPATAVSLSLPKAVGQTLSQERVFPSSAPLFHTFHHFSEQESFRLVQPSSGMSSVHSISSTSEQHLINLSYSDQTAYLLSILPLNDSDAYSQYEGVAKEITLSGFPARHLHFTLSASDSTELFSQWSDHDFAQQLMQQEELIELNAFAFRTKAHAVLIMVLGVHNETAASRALHFANSLQIDTK